VSKTTRRKYGKAGSLRLPEAGQRGPVHVFADLPTFVILGSRSASLRLPADDEGGEADLRGDRHVETGEGSSSNPGPDKLFFAQKGGCRIKLIGRGLAIGGLRQGGRVHNLSRSIEDN
jgi:hypothetical protein